MKRTTFAVLLALVAAPVLLYGAGEEGSYIYADRRDLGEWLAFQRDGYQPPSPVEGVEQAVPDFLDKPVLTVDELAIIWSGSNQDVANYLKFDTMHLRCLVPVDQSASLGVLQELRRQMEDEGWRAPRSLMIRGSFRKLEVRGPVSPDAKRQGVASEQIYFVVDRLSRPQPLRAKDLETETE